MFKKYKYLLLSVVALSAMVFTATLGSNFLNQVTASVTGYLSYGTTLKAPTIWSPASKAVLTNYPRTTSLSWSYVTGATSYEIELACDTCVSSTNLYSSPSTYTTSLNYYVTEPLAGDNNFRFRVKAKSGISSSKWTNYKYFSFKTSSTTTPTAPTEPTTPTTPTEPTTPTTPEATLDIPTITYPAANAVLTNYPRAAYLDWKSVSNATSYDIELVGDGGCGSASYTATHDYYTTPALCGDNTFHFRVRAKNATTTGAWSDFRYFSYKTVAATLGIPTITTPVANKVLTNYPRTAYLAWYAVTNATSYEIEMVCDYCGTSTYTSTHNYYTTPALAGDNTFHFRVRAKNATTTGAWSDYSYFSYSTVAATLGTPTITYPAANAVLTNYPRVTDLDWNSVTNATSYDIEIGCDTCVSSTNLYSSPTIYTSYYNYYTTNPLAGDNTFRFKVRAKNATTTGAWSDYRYFSYKTVAATLGTPTITTPSANKVLTNYPRTAYLAWYAVTNATSYEIEMVCDYCGTSTYTSTHNYYTTPALAGDNTFHFRVRAKNATTTGAWSDYSYFSYSTVAATLGTPTITAPASYAVLTNYPRYASLAWSYVTNATSYDVEIGCDTCVSSTNLYSGATTYNMAYNDYLTPALAGDNTFRFRVRAKNATTTGAWSDYRYFSYNTAPVALGVPTIWTPVANKVLTNYPRTAYLYWSSVTGATSYDIEVACDTCVSTTNLYSGATTYTSTHNYYTTPALAGDNTFRFRVRAKNSSTGAWSDYRYFSYDTSSYVD